MLLVMPTGHDPSTLGGAHNACRIPFGHPGSVLGYMREGAVLPTQLPFPNAQRSGS